MTEYEISKLKEYEEIVILETHCGCSQCSSYLNKVAHKKKDGFLYCNKEKIPSYVKILRYEKHSIIPNSLFEI